MSEERWDVTEPHAGDMIRVNAGAYYHYGIYIGGDEVVQFGRADDAAGDPSMIRIMRSGIDEFLCGKGFLEVRVLSREEKRKKRPDKEIVAYALSRVGEGGYDLLRNNCQHFANECVFAEKGRTRMDAIREEIRNKLKKRQ